MKIWPQQTKLIAAAALFLLVVFGVCLSFFSVKSETTTDLNQEIVAQRAKIDELDKKIGEYQENIKKVRSEASSLKNQLVILENQIAASTLEIEAKELEIAAIEAEIVQISGEIKANEERIEKEKGQLAAFIRQMDAYDQKGYLTVLLGYDSFSDFFDQVKHLESVKNGAQKGLNRVQEMVANLNAKKSELDEKRNRLSELLNKMEQTKLSLESQRGDKKYLIAQTQSSEKKYQNLIGSLKQEQLSINSQVAELEKKLRAELAKRGATEKFNALGAADLSWPSPVRTITSSFHDPDYPYRHLFEHSGLDLALSSGSQVKAAEAGYVAKVTKNNKWYGHYVMIIHNNNLSTLYAHLSGINVAVDQYVTKGQVIAASGNSGFSSGPHLHFEVRYNGIPVNPLNYLP